MRFAMIFAGLPEYCSSLKRRKLLPSATFLIHIILTKELAHWVVQMKRITFSTMPWVIMEKVMIDVEEIKIKSFPICSKNEGNI